MTKSQMTQKTRFMEREKQMDLARQRGEAHIGADAAKSLAAKREAKLKGHQKILQIEEAEYN